MGRANNSWSASNSTGTTNMGIWDEEPDISSQPLVKQSEIKSKWTPRDIDGIATHRYPLYIDNLNGKNNAPIVQECIHFTAVKQGGISLQKIADNSAALSAIEREQDNIANKGDTGDLGEDTGALGGTGATGSFDAVSQTLNAKKSQINTVQSKRNESETVGGKLAGLGEGVLAQGGAFIEAQIKLIREKPKNLEHCFLYMPASIQFSEGASWGATALGGVGNLVKEGIRGGGSIGDILKNFSGGVITKVAQGVALGAGAAAAGTLGALGAASIFEGLGGGLRAAGRFTANPYEEQLFNGIDFRTFTFEFAFAPSNEAEANEVDSIIEMFRYHSRPNFVGGFLGEGLYTFPNEFNIEFLMNENGAFDEHPWIPSIYNCVCTNVSTNYSPEGFWVALRDGRPVSYNLSLAFTETKKITQEDIEEGY